MTLEMIWEIIFHNAPVKDHRGMDAVLVDPDKHGVIGLRLCYN